MHDLSPSAGAADTALPYSVSLFADASDDSLDDAASPFAGVPAVVAKALSERGFAGMTAVQEAVLAADAAGRDLQISSQTGSGKTVALGLVIAPRLLEEVASGGLAARAQRPLLAMVITPTRELAVQVGTELEWLFAGIRGVAVECVTGGSSAYQERRRLAARPTVVVGTPGRLLDHIRSGSLDCSTVAELVLDEADRMLDMGFREELEAILDAANPERRTHLVSATFPSEIQKLARKYQRDPLSVEGTRLGAANEDIEHVGHLVRMTDRYDALVNILLLAAEERTLIFVNTRVQTSELADKLAADGFAAAPISGELEQAQRTRTLDAFRNGNVGILVATDVAARGLDIPDVAMVIHTDTPFDAESYTHRAGRTGRAGRKGRSVLLASPQRRAKVDFLMSRAKVRLAWREVPSAQNVEKALAKRERRRLREALAASPEPTALQIENAAALLGYYAKDVPNEREETAASAQPGTRSGADAVAVLVARLVELCRPPRKAAPRDVESRAAAPASVKNARGAVLARRDRAGAPTRRFEDAARTRNYDRSAARFEINWGGRHGATPQRLLALLCRRGDVSSRMIGTIDIDVHRTVFEVADDVSGFFEENATRPDRRDPDLQIRPLQRREEYVRTESRRGR